MKFQRVIFFGVILAASSALLLGCNRDSHTEVPHLNLMPYPQQVSAGNGHFALNVGFSVVIDPSTKTLDAATQRFLQRVAQQTGLAFAQRESEATRPGELHITLAQALDDTLRDHDQWPQNERYELTITEQRITLNAASETGILRGLETLLQLIGTEHSSTSITLPALKIVDSPRFPWRGLLIDSARHFLPLETLKRQIDGMAAAKLNVFHWHLTDDQGWRLESKVFPKLHQLASNGQFYSHEQVKELVAYAKARGIEVMPEIDMPGHASAIGVAHPELMSAPGPYAMEDRWGVHTPLMNPANEAVYEFADQLLEEVAALFPFSYVHIGGDEVNPRDWQNNAEIQAFMSQHKIPDEQALHAYFNQRIAKILAKHDRKIIGWDEIRHPDLPKDIVIQSWQGPDALGEAVNNGYQAILSTGFYLDQPQPAGYHYRNRLLPQPIAVDDNIQADEHWQTWSFTMPRKRGSAISGSFTIITNEAGGKRGFIDFANQSRRAIHKIRIQNDTLHFELDTWMGELEPRLRMQQGKLTGEARMGNAKYTVTGEQIAGSDHPNKAIPAGKPPAIVDESQRHLVLGGEAALWSELVDESNIDVRLWPRAFVVAERLWSPAELRDEDLMYQRINAVAAWAETSVGLKHRQQMIAGMRALSNDSQRIEPLLILAEAVEPAHYYHRHHEKSVNETYSRRDPLNRLADVLPAESEQTRELANAIDAWLANPADHDAKAIIEKRLSRWAANYYPLRLMINHHEGLSSLQNVANTTHKVATLGLKLMSHLEHGQPLNQTEYKQAQMSLLQAQEISDELVVAAAYPIERLLYAIDNLPQADP